MSEPIFRFSPRPNRAHEIHWHEWGNEAFMRASSEQKPILLSISAVWCHWCHVMDETTYSQPDVIRRINEDFIAIRVDNDQRPDINLRYNMGGWPTTAILTAAGEIITGGTYVPADQMASLLDQVLQYWRENREQIGDQLAEPQTPTLNPDLTQPTNETVIKIMDLVRGQFDRAYGGVGLAPKFPQVDIWDLCLTFFTATGDGWSAGMTARTLDAMAGGGLYDHVEGGFFRYSTTREWTVPHFEKMLEENAQLSKLYLKAYQIMGDESYREVANATLQWANTVLLNEDGLWSGSQDADEEYYALTKEDREKRSTPFVDPVVHTNWNAYMISTQLSAAALINPQVYAPIAMTALEVLWDRMWHPQKGLYHYDSGDGPQILGLLTDVAALTNTVIDAYEYSGDAIFLERAETLLDYAERTLLENGVYQDQPKQDAEFGRLRHRQQPLPDNAAMARAWIRLAGILDRPEYKSRAEAILGAFSPAAEEQGLFAAAWAVVTDRVEAEPMVATIVESHSRSGANLRQAIYGVYDRNRIVRTWPIGSRQFEASDYPEIPMPALYICRGTVCAAPVTEPEGLLQALQELAGVVPEPETTLPPNA